MTWPAPDFEHLLLSSRAMQQLEGALLGEQRVVAEPFPCALLLGIGGTKPELGSSAAIFGCALGKCFKN